MADSPKVKLTSAARATAAPLRNYFNNHFEMTKQEVRRVVADSGVAALEHAQTGRHLAELSNVVAETQLYQSKLISELRREVAALREELAQVSSTSAELAAVLTAMTLAPDVD
jgi:signal-transduction protein with cAMP-binding, CBS, and nucleotidyltransferase domain